MNYVIQMTEGEVDKYLFESVWQYPLSNTTYQKCIWISRGENCR